MFEELPPSPQVDIKHYTEAQLTERIGQLKFDIPFEQEITAKYKRI